MVKTYMYENLKHTVIKQLAKKIKKYSHFHTITTNNSKHVSDFISNDILTLSWSYSQTILHTFPDTFTRHFSRELLVNNTRQFSRVYIKQY